MFRPRRFIMLRHFIFRICDHFVRISAYEMLMCQDISGLMHKRRVFFHRLKRIQHRLIHLVIYLDKTLRLFQDLRRLGCDQTDRVSDIMGHVSDRNHRIPIMFQMSDFHVSRNIIRGKYADHAVQRFRFFGMDRQYFCTRIFCAYRASVNHAVQINIVRIFSGTQYFFCRIHALDFIANFCNTAIFRYRKIFTEDFSAQQDSLDDLFIPGTTADIIADCRHNFQPGRIRIHIQKSFRTHDHTRNTKTTLNSSDCAKCICIYFFFPFRKSLHRHDRFSLHFGDHRDAGPCCLSVHQNCTSSAGALTASVFDGSQVQVIPQKAHQLFVCFCFIHFSVYLNRIHITLPFFRISLRNSFFRFLYFLFYFYADQKRSDLRSISLNSSSLVSTHRHFSQCFSITARPPTSPLNFSNSEKYSRSQSTGFPVLFP